MIIKLYQCLYYITMFDGCPPGGTTHFFHMRLASKSRSRAGSISIFAYSHSAIPITDSWLMKYGLPSGKLTVCYGKSPCYSWVNPLFLRPFSIAILTLPEGHNMDIWFSMISIQLDCNCWLIPFQIWKMSSGWWYTYPSEKHESQLGVLFPIYGK